MSKWHPSYPSWKSQDSDPNKSSEMLQDVAMLSCLFVNMVVHEHSTFIAGSGHREGRNHREFARYTWTRVMIDAVHYVTFIYLYIPIHICTCLGSHTPEGINPTNTRPFHTKKGPNPRNFRKETRQRLF